MRTTIKKHSDFAMGDNSPTIKTNLFIVRCETTKFPDNARYGLIATKRTFKLAVSRNRAKRLLRTWIRQNESLLKPDYDYIFIARNTILKAAPDDGFTNMKNALEQLQ